MMKFANHQKLILKTVSLCDRDVRGRCRPTYFLACRAACRTLHYSFSLNSVDSSLCFGFKGFSSDQISPKTFQKAKITLTHFSLFKVAVHSFVEKLFGSIWGMPHSKAPPAVKYFFDFLDRQADNMKITDPDVLHIWKTNR